MPKCSAKTFCHLDPFQTSFSPCVKVEFKRGREWGSSETGPCSFVNVERNWRPGIPPEVVHSETSSLFLQSFLEVCSLVIQIGCQLCVQQPIGIIHCNKIRKQRRLGQLSKCHPSEHRYANVMWVKSKTISCKESRTLDSPNKRALHPVAPPGLRHTSLSATVLPKRNFTS